MNLNTFLRLIPVVILCWSVLVFGSLRIDAQGCTDATGGPIDCPHNSDNSSNNNDDSTTDITTETDDRDGDGLANNDDACPGAGGPAQNAGCPETDDTDTTPDTTESDTEPLALPTLSTDQGCILATLSDVPVNVREIASTNGLIIGVLNPLQVYTVVISTTNDEGTWYLVGEAGGWVAMTVVRVAGNCQLKPRVSTDNLKVESIPGEAAADLTRFKVVPPEGDPLPFDMFVNFDGSIDVDLPDGPHSLQIAPFGGDPLPPEIDWIAILPDVPDEPAIMVFAIPEDTTLDDFVSTPLDPEALQGDYDGNGTVDAGDFVSFAAESQPSMVFGNLSGVFVLNPNFLHMPALPLADAPEIIPDGEIGCFIQKETDNGIIKTISKVSVSGLVVPIEGVTTYIHTAKMLVGKGTKITFDVVADSAFTSGKIHFSPYDLTPPNDNPIYLPDTTILTTNDFDKPTKLAKVSYLIDEAVGSSMTATLVCS